LLKLLKENLLTTQHRMKLNEDWHLLELDFAMGDFVYLKLQPFQQMSISIRGNMKLSPQFYGPYEVMECLGKVAYRLALPSSSQIHLVFHVS